MKVSGERRFDAPRETVWQVLNDPAQMAKTMPGVESFDIQDDRHWRAHVKIPLGLGGLRMSIDFEKMEEREPEFAKRKRMAGVDDGGLAVDGGGRGRRLDPGTVALAESEQALAAELTPELVDVVQASPSEPAAQARREKRRQRRRTRPHGRAR